jgi:hypothetical protein
MGIQGATLFRRGYGAVEQEKERQDRIRASIGKKLFNFFLPSDGDEADIRFLTEEPISCYVHRIRGVRNGKEAYETFVCPRNGGLNPDAGCPDCDAGERATFQTAFLIIDRRPYSYTDKNGKEQKGKEQIRLYMCGQRVASQLSRLSAKGGISNREYLISRNGSGTNTTYMFERGERFEVTEEEIRGLLPEKLRDMYDGTMDSLYSIVEGQVEMLQRGAEDAAADAAAGDDGERGGHEPEPEFRAPWDGDEEAASPKVKHMFKKAALKRRA